MLRDLRFAVRSAVRTPLFSLLTVVTLALGIGANAALFGIVKPLLLDPLPYAEQERLVRLSGRNAEAVETGWGLTAGMVDDLKRSQRSFSALAASFGSTQEVVIGATDRPQVGSALIAEPELFSLLGVQPQLGRLSFLPEEMPTENSGRFMILSHDAWQRFTGADPEIVGKALSVFEVPRTVVGVLPPDFVGPLGDADVYLPLNLSMYLANPVTARRSFMFTVIGRLAPGVAPAAAREELDAIAANIQRDHPEDVRGVGFRAQDLRTAMVGDTRTPLLILLASAVLVLVIACANLAGAMLSRVLARRKEFAVRSALGAGRATLVRQLLTESTVLALVGGVLGVAVAAAALVLARDLVADALPHFATLSLDGGAVVAMLTLTVIAGVAVGALPAVVVGRAPPQQGIAAQARGATEGRQSGHLRGLLVAAQIALCLALLVSAGLLARSLWGIATAPLGVDAERVVTARTTLPFARYGEPAQRFRFQEQLLERVRALPGVTTAATTMFLPQGVDSSNTFELDARPLPEGQPEPWALWTAVSDDYFATLHVPLLQGRTFDSRDALDTQRVIVINESMARRHWPDGDAIGARVRIGPDFDSPRWEVIGIVADVRNDPASTDVDSITYMSHRQEPVSSPWLVVRTAGDPHALLGLLERELAAVDSALPFQDAATLPAVFSENLAPRRLPLTLMAGFGALALLLAAVGVYAMFATMAAARERELGIRVALGASRGSIVRLVVGQGAAWLSLGVVAGAVIAAFVGIGLRDLLYQVSPFDPLTLALATVVLVAAAALALSGPVRRATRVDPVMVLRSD